MVSTVRFISIHLSIQSVSTLVKQQVPLYDMNQMKTIFIVVKKVIQSHEEVLILSVWIIHEKSSMPIISILTKLLPLFICIENTYYYNRHHSAYAIKKVLTK